MSVIKEGMEKKEKEMPEIELGAKQNHQQFPTSLCLGMFLQFTMPEPAAQLQVYIKQNLINKELFQACIGKEKHHPPQAFQAFGWESYNKKWLTKEKHMNLLNVSFT